MTGFPNPDQDLNRVFPGANQPNQPRQIQHPHPEDTTADGYAQSILQNPDTAFDSAPNLSNRVITNISLQPQGDETASIEKGLKKWIETGGDESNQANRHYAAKKILEAYRNKAATLNLAELNLTTLPPEIGSLTALKKLDISRNQLASLPPEIGRLVELNELTLNNNNLTSLPSEFGNLTALKNLDLDSNQLTSLPPEFGSLIALNELHLTSNQLTSLPREFGSLAALEWLYLESNQLSSLPPEIGSLAALAWLDLSGNKLTSLPPEIGNLAELGRLDIHNNPDLESLPMPLGNCQGITELDIDRTGISVVERDAILARTRAIRDSAGLLTLPTRLETWKAYAGVDIDLGFVSDEHPFTDEQKINIGEWLIRLERCQDFKYKREEVAKLVCNMLVTLKDSPEFKDAFFGKLAGNLEHCDDRASMLLNMLYTDWKLCTIDPNTSDREKIELFVKLAKTLTLRETLESMIVEYQIRTKTTLRESVEIFLYHEITNKDLGLLTAIDNMHYTAMGEAPNVVDKEILRKTVEEKHMDTLGNQEDLDKILKEYPGFVNEKRRIEEDTEKKFDKIEDQDWTDKLGQYNAALEALGEEKQNAIRDLRKKYTKIILNKDLNKDMKKLRIRT